MTDEYERTHLWKSTLAKQKKDEDELARERLRGAYLKFRDRVSHLVATIRSELPGLTVHDITHLDALWRVASEIAGPKYALTPAEAFVLGGAILLHDSAHAIAAFPGGKTDIKQTQHWRDLIAQRYNRQEPAVGSDDERVALFQVLRHLHATQAAKLPFAKWQVPGDNTPNFLIEDAELRNYYGELIGKIAESHHWPAHRVATEFSHQNHTPPSYLPTEWTVDAMKIAFLLRTADAAHIDDARAPWFLFALQKPDGISAQHWHFQSKLGQPRCNEHGELQISSASSFSADERDAWWLAYDTVQMIDRELRDAHGLMRDHGRDVFQSTSVLGAGSPESFARYVKPKEREPVDVAPKIGNVSKIIEMLGGEKLYGDHPEYALRELLQNAIDAIHAKRALGGLGPEEGDIVVALDKIDDDNYRLSVTDNGIGMSKYVMTNVLLDFGNSLWKSDALRDQLPGLAQTGFESAGQFGIGFFSVFMLSDNVSILSRAWSSLSVADNAIHELSFHNGLTSRPVIGVAKSTDLPTQSGTRVSLVLAASKLANIVRRPDLRESASEPSWYAKRLDALGLNDAFLRTVMQPLRDKIASLAPTSDTKISLMAAGSAFECVAPSDWIEISDDELRIRIESQNKDFPLHPLLNRTGMIVGRVGLGLSFIHELLLTHGGVQCGRGTHFTGVLTWAGSRNAARSEPVNRHADLDWARWARHMLPYAVHENDQDNLATIHQVVPDDDIAIFRFSDQLFTLHALAEQLKTRHEFAVFHGHLSADDDDGVAGHLFGIEFEGARDCVFFPSFLYPMEFLQIPTIDYWARLRDALRAELYTYTEVDVEEFQIGTVTGVEIFRTVRLFSRT